MNAEIICVGTELLLGDIVNTNAQYLSQKLAQLGIDVFYQSAVGDNPARLKKVLSTAVSRSNIIILTGGLGPTQDDLTVKTVCDAIGYSLEENAEALERIKAHFRATGRQMTQNNLKQAMVPSGAVVFQNDVGTAPGCAIEQGNQTIIFLPGPPSEMQAMYETKVEPYLQKYADGVIESHFIHLFGLGESQIDEKISDLVSGSNPTVAPYAKTGETTLRVTAKAETKNVAAALCKNMIKEILNRFGDYVYGADNDSLQSVAVQLLKKRNMTVATAESCTAGYISKRLTDIPGSSAVFKMGTVTYSNESKEELVHVPPELIRQHGAVSMQVAAAMAKGVRQTANADIGLSITGIAGPDNDGTDKPVGLCYIAISDKNGEYGIQINNGSHHDREYIRYVSASAALNFLRLYLKHYPAVPPQATVVRDILTEDVQAAGQTHGIIPPVMPVMPGMEDDAVAALEDAGAMPPSGDTLADMEMPDAAAAADTPDTDLNGSGDIAQQLHLQADEAADFSVTADDYAKKLQAFLGEEADEQTAPEQTEASVSDFFGANFAENQKTEEPAEDTAAALDDDFKLTDTHQDENSVKSAVKTGAAAAKKPNIAVRALKYMFPWKGDSAKEITRKIIFLVALITLIVTLWQVIAYYIDPLINGSKVNDMRDRYHNALASGEPWYQDLYAQNNDLVGWVQIEDTNIDYPVVQAEDNDYYLRRGFDGTYTRYGTIFMDYTSFVREDTESRNIVLYGHNMKDDSTMFGQLPRYRALDYYKEHPIVTFNTLYYNSEWKIFAVMTTNAFKEQDNGHVFEYRQANFVDDNEFNAFINECRLRSNINTTVDVLPTDTILTLQTCVYEFSEARFVVMARKVRPGEESKVDTAGATYNENAKYPQAWYDAQGTSNPYADQVYTTAVGGASLVTSTAPAPDPVITVATQERTDAAHATTARNNPRYDNDDDDDDDNSGGSSNNRPANTTRRPATRPPTAATTTRPPTAATTTKAPTTAATITGTEPAESEPATTEAEDTQPETTEPADTTEEVPAESSESTEE